MVFECCFGREEEALGNDKLRCFCLTAKCSGSLGFPGSMNGRWENCPIVSEHLLWQTYDEQSARF